MSFEEYRDAVFKDLGYQPTESQWPVFEDLHRVKIVVGGERAGKTDIGEKTTLLQALRGNLIWLAGNEYADCRAEFERLALDLSKLNLLKGKPSFPKEGACSLETINGCVVETKATKEFFKLGSYPPDFILICEAARIEYEAYLRLRARAAEKRAEIMATGTFESSLGWYPEYYLRGQSPADPEIRSFSIPSWTNHYVYPLGRNDPEILRLENELPSDVFMERLAAVPCPPSGLIMKEFSNAVHVGEYPYDPNWPVEIAVDPGYGGAYAVEAIQVRESIPYLVDEIYLQGYTTEDVITILHQKEWGHKVTAGAIDVAGKQHQAMAAPIEVWRDKTGLYLESQYVEVEEGINLLRSMLKVNPITNKPKLYVNATCHGFISECGGCKSPVHGGGSWKRDVNTGKVIDRNNHATKAVIYWSVNKYGYSSMKQETTYGKVYKLDGKQTENRIESEWLKKILKV